MEDMKEEKTGTKKHLKRAVIFVIAAALVFVYLNAVFTIADSDSNKRIFNAFYAQEKDSIDVVYFGTSATNRYFVAPEAYNDAGISSFDLAVMGMPLFFVTNLMDEVEKTQSPSLYIIELRNVLKDKNDVTDAHIRRVTDSMRISANKYAAIEKALEYTDGASGEKSNIDDGALDYYVPVIKYHGRLTEGDISWRDFLLLRSKNETKGYVLTDKTLTQVSQKEPVYSDDIGELAPEMEETLEEILDACDERDADVLFVLSPYSMKAGEAEVFNKAISIVESRGYSVLNFNTPEMAETLELDWETDFYNSKHVNYLGAEKYTDYLTRYIAENYELADHRGDDGYESWDDSYQVYLDFISDGIIKN